MRQTHPVRLGLIGAGRWGQTYIRTIAAEANVSLIGLASQNPKFATHASSSYRLFKNWRDLINWNEIDGVIIASPPASHAEIAALAIEKKLPVLIEKPLTLNLAEANNLCALAQHHNSLVMVDHTHLFSPAFRGLKSMATEIGNIQTIQSIAGNRGLFRNDASVLWDWGPHDISMCMDLLNQTPTIIQVNVVERRESDKGIGEMLNLVLAFGTVTANLTFGTLTDKVRRFSVTVDGQTLVYDDLATDKLSMNDQRIEISSERPLSVVVREFAEAITLGNHDQSGLNLGHSVVQTLSQCQAMLDSKT